MFKLAQYDRKWRNQLIRSFAISGLLAGVGSLMLNEFIGIASLTTQSLSSLLIFWSVVLLFSCKELSNRLVLQTPVFCTFILYGYLLYALYAPSQGRYTHELILGVLLGFPIIFGIQFSLFKTQKALILALLETTGLITMILPHAYATQNSNTAFSGFIFPLVIVVIYGIYLRLLHDFAVIEMQLRSIKKETERINAMAHYDVLTGVPNRRGAEVLLDNILIDAQTNNRSFSVLMLDIDHFKQVNDTHGHQAGDELLKAFSAHISAQLREDDLLARWGGEEFLIIAPNTDQNNRHLILKRLESSITDDSLFIPGVTFSAGFTTYHPGDTRQALIQRADTALYKAKAAGRNRIEVFSSEAGLSLAAS